MPTTAHFIAATRQLLIGGHEAPELSVMGGPPLRYNQLSDIARHAYREDRDIVCLIFGDDVTAGPTGVQLIFPRADMVHVRLNGALWAPKDDGLCAIVNARGGKGSFAFDRDELAHSPGRIARDVRPGIRRARARPITQASSAAADEAACDVGIRLVVRP